MTDILFTANGASATALVSGELTSGMVGLPVRFSFDSDWDGLNIVAVFDGGGQRISVPLLTDMEAVLPWEVITKANTRLRIGAEGRKSDGSVVIPTVWANADYIKEGAVATDEEGNPPTPGIYDQIMAAIEAGKLKGEKGDKGDPGERGPVGPAGPQGEKGETPALADDLYTKDSDMALSANMGVVLRDKIDNDLLTVQKELQAEIKQRVKTVNGVAPDENGNVVVEVPEGGGGSGVTVAEKELILSLFKNTAYTADMSATIAQLEALWSGSGDEPDAPVEPDEPVIPVYTVTNNLTGITNSNPQTEVSEGFYSASLSWESGYELNSITITMGGVDITADVYGEGNILITEVTGDIVITAVAALPPAVYVLPEPLALSTTPTDTGIALFAEKGPADKAFTICIDITTTALKAYSNVFECGYGHMQYYGWQWRVFWRSGNATPKNSAGEGITGNLTNCKLIFTKEAGKGNLTVYNNSVNVVDEIAPTNYGNTTKESTVMLNPDNENTYAGTFNDFRIYERALTIDEIKAYFGEV